MKFASMKEISLKEAKRKLYRHRHNDSRNFFFTVAFVKRTGKREPRKMNARFNVKKYLVGGKMAFKPKDYHLISTFDVEKANYRMINLETLMYLKLNKQEYIVRENRTLARKHLPTLL